jgi:hypothetical protein
MASKQEDPSRTVVADSAAEQAKGLSKAARDEVQELVKENGELVGAGGDADLHALSRLY